MDFSHVATTWKDHSLLRKARARLARLLSSHRVHGPGQPAARARRMADLHTDDMAGACSRLEAKGIRTVARTAELCVMETPGGQRFYVFSPARARMD